MLTVINEFTASLVIVRCSETNAGSLRWNIRFDTSLKPDITIAVRMDRLNQKPLDYYLLPSLDMTLPRIRLAEHNGLSLDAYRFETLDPLFDMAVACPSTGGGLMADPHPQTAELISDGSHHRGEPAHQE